MNSNKSDFFKYLYIDNEDRVINKKNINKDLLQWEFNESKLEEENCILKEFSGEYRHKIVFIVGVPRSGTTLLNQLIVDSFKVGAFYNSIAKYYSVPLYGLKQLLNENEFKKNKIQKLDSLLGNTQGSLAPHEFGYFWQYWLNHSTSDELNEIEKKKVKWKALAEKLHAYTNILETDLTIKSIVYNDFIVRELSESIPNSHFIYIKRAPLFVAQSIIESRVKQYGSEKHWWSIKPADYKKWLNLTVEQQVANQIIYTSKKIEEQLSQLNPDKVITISYEELVKKSTEFFDTIQSKFSLKKQDRIIQPKRIKNGNILRFGSDKVKKIEIALNNAKEEYY